MRCANCHGLMGANWRAGATSGSLSDNSAAGGSYQPPPSQLPAWSHLPAPTANINQGVITSGIQVHPVTTRTTQTHCH